MTIGGGIMGGEPVVWGKKPIEWPDVGDYAYVWMWRLHRFKCVERSGTWRTWKVIQADVEGATPTTFRTNGTWCPKPSIRVWRDVPTACRWMLKVICESWGKGNISDLEAKAQVWAVMREWERAR